MKTKNIKMGITELDAMFTHAFIALYEKGYNIDRLCICKGHDFYEEYKELPMDFIAFKDILRVRSVPIGFELAHITDEGHSMLFYRYEDNLSGRQVLNRKLKVAAALLLWVSQLPFNDKAR